MTHEKTLKKLTKKHHIPAVLHAHCGGAIEIVPRIIENKIVMNTKIQCTKCRKIVKDADIEVK